MENGGGGIYHAGCAWEIQLRPLARRASYRYHNSKNSNAPPPPPSSCPHRSRYCPLAFPSAPFPYIVYIIYSLYVYITSPTLPTFLFIGFVGKSPPSLAPPPHVLRALPPYYLYHPLVTLLLLFFLPNHRLHSSAVVVALLPAFIFSPLVSFIPPFFPAIPFPFSTSYLVLLSEHPREYIFLQGS